MGELPPHFHNPPRLSCPHKQKSIQVHPNPLKPSYLQSQVPASNPGTGAELSTKYPQVGMESVCS